VVDNHSAEDVQDFLNEYFHDIRIIRNRSNHGFGWANNRGAKAAQGEYLLFLNSDTEVTADALLRMVEIMERDPGIGALGPMLLNADGSFQLSFGRAISLRAELFQKILAPSWEKCKLALRNKSRVLKNVAWVSGACLLTRKELFLSGLVFDEEMFLYFEDHDLCLRIRAMGKRVVYCPGARVIHYLGRSVAAAVAKTMVEYRKSQMYLYRKQRKFLALFLLKKYLKWKYTAKLKKTSLTASEQSQDERQVYQEILTLL
jgi:GT2 family glycosyltransferase